MLLSLLSGLLLMASLETPFSLTQYRWENRVLVVSAPTQDNEVLMKQLNDLALSPEEFADRDMALVILLDDAASDADGRELTTEEVASTRAALRIRRESFALRLIGKDGGVKFSSDALASMAEIYALIDTMPMRRLEKRQ